MIDKKEVKKLIKILQDLIRINTSNPPGNELKAATYLQRLFKKYRIKSRIIKTTKKRGSLIAKLKGKKPGKKILLLCHLDTVSANPKEWKHNPFKGVIKNGYIWGRGAIDCKGLVSQFVWNFIKAKQRGIDKGELIFVASADEELDSKLGTDYLLRKFPFLNKVDYVLTEGGGLGINVNNKNKYVIDVAGKGDLWIKLKIKGNQRHPSIPDMNGDGLSFITAQIIEKIQKYKTPITISPIIQNLIKELFEDNFLEREILLSKSLTNTALEIYNEKHPEEASAANALVRDIITPIKIEVGEKANLTPSKSEILLIARILPNSSPTKIKSYIKQALGKKLFSQVDYEVLDYWPPTKTNYHNDKLFSLIEHSLKKLDKKAVLVPFMSLGTPESCFFRKNKTKSYGFQPLLITKGEAKKAAHLIHGVNERISVDSLIFGAEFFNILLKDFLS